LLLFFLLVGGCFQQDKNRTSQLLPLDYQQSYSLVRGCRLIRGHDANSIVVLANAEARADYVAGNSPLPQGSVIVAVGIRQDGLFERHRLHPHVQGRKGLRPHGGRLATGSGWMTCAMSWMTGVCRRVSAATPVPTGRLYLLAALMDLFDRSAGKRPGSAQEEILEGTIERIVFLGRRRRIHRGTPFGATAQRSPRPW